MKHRYIKQIAIYIFGLSFALSYTNRAIYWENSKVEFLSVIQNVQLHLSEFTKIDDILVIARANMEIVLMTGIALAILSVILLLTTEYFKAAVMIMLTIQIVSLLRHDLYSGELGKIFSEPIIKDFMMIGAMLYMAITNEQSPMEPEGKVMPSRHEINIDDI